MELIVYDKAGKQSEKHRMYFIVVGEDFGDEPPLVQFTAPRPTDSQREDLVVVTGNLISGAENGDVKIEVALDPAVLDYSTSQKITQKQIGKFNLSEMNSDGDTFSLTLDISDVYQVETGVASTIYIRITEGDGSRYVISETIDISLVPRGGGFRRRELSRCGPQYDNYGWHWGVKDTSHISCRGNFSCAWSL